MSFDGFDAAVLIETISVLPFLAPEEPTDSPTLQDALAANRDTPAPNFSLPDGSGAEPAPGDIGVTALRPLKPDEMLLLAGGNGSEISVWGPGPEPDPWDWWDDDDPTYDYDPGYWGNGGGSGDTPPANDPFEDRVTIDPSVPADQMDRAHQIEAQLQAQMKEMDDKIQSLPDNALITIGNTTYTGAEIKANWEHLSFSITWGRDYGPLGSASNVNGIVGLNLGDAEIFIGRYGSSTLWGSDDLFLHELALLFPADLQFQNSEWIAYLNNGGDPNDRAAWQHSSYFQDGERYTNSWASAIGGRIGVPGYN